MSQPSKDLTRIEAAVDKAQNAFWAVIVEHFPEAKTGDFDMFCDSKMQEWVTRWVHLNADLVDEQLYAVQFRSMHDAIHSIAIFNNELEAEDLFYYINKHGKMPTLNFDSLIGFDEIDFRQRPTQFNNVKLTYVNPTANTIPDVYG